MKNSYKKAFRLKKQNDIVNLVRNANKFNCNIFVVLYEKNNLAQDRFNVLVSKKNGNAVQRVRIKRIYREAYINTEITSGGCFYDILVRPLANCEHKFNEIFELYGKWRNETIKNGGGKRDLLCDTTD